MIKSFVINVMIKYSVMNKVNKSGMNSSNTYGRKFKNAKIKIKNSCLTNRRKTNNLLSKSDKQSDKVICHKYQDNLQSRVELINDSGDKTPGIPTQTNLYFRYKMLNLENQETSLKKLWKTMPGCINRSIQKAMHIEDGRVINQSDFMSTP